LGREIESTSLAFGNRVDNGSSNAYACGSNQNVGNGITDRRTTRVLRPPGGASQISFG
jgi:SPIRAL1-like protein